METIPWAAPELFLVDFLVFVILLFWMLIINEHLKLCAMLCLVAQLHPILCDPMGCNLPRSSIRGDSSGTNTGVGCLLQGSSNSGIKLRSPALQADSLPSDPPGKPKTLSSQLPPLSPGAQVDPCRLLKCQ